MHVPYSARDENLVGNSCEPTHPQENSSLSSLHYQQEVPSSYSSVSGNEGAGDRYEQFNSSSSMHVVSVSHNHAQPLPPAVSRSGWVEEQRHLLSSKPNESVIGGPVRVLDPMVSVFKLCLDSLVFIWNCSSSHASHNLTRGTGQGFAATVVFVPPPVEISAGSVLKSALVGGISCAISTSLLHLIRCHRPILSTFFPEATYVTFSSIITPVFKMILTRMKMLMIELMPCTRCREL